MSNPDTQAKSFTRIGRTGVRVLLPAGLVLGLLIVLAPSGARAGDEFEDGFKSELGRIAAHEAFGLGKGVLGQVIHGGHQRAGRHDDHRGGHRASPKKKHHRPRYRENWHYGHRDNRHGQYYRSHSHWSHNYKRRHRHWRRHHHSGRRHHGGHHRHGRSCRH
ncbi:MAG: hypothetical protein GY725_04150 [bacterium]|nr:hypothetical protein [bacterium]